MLFYPYNSLQLRPYLYIAVTVEMHGSYGYLSPIDWPLLPVSAEYIVIILTHICIIGILGLSVVAIAHKSSLIGYTCLDMMQISEEKETHISNPIVINLLVNMHVTIF